jgi:hypothetical protein
MTLRNGSHAVSGVRPSGRLVWLAAFLAFALLLTWPGWINGGALVFFDSPGYVQQGRSAIMGVVSILGPAEMTGDGAAAAAGGAGGFGAAAASAEFIRSLGYSSYAFLAWSTPLGSFAIILGHAVLIAALIALLASREIARAPLAALGAFAVVILLTPLPWYVSYLMPDILAAVPILCAMIAVRRGEDLGAASLAFLLLAGTFAALSHYGHVPLALATGLAATGLLLFQRKLTLALSIVLIAPPFLATALNMAGSRVAFEETSAAPKRLPLLLGRSIEDGPARWYLTEACPERGYAICELFDEIPSNLHALLWVDDGILRRATPDQIRRIRDEEAEILYRAFLRYPVQQIGALAGNSLHQMVLVGLRDVQWGAITEDPLSDRIVRAEVHRDGLDGVAAVHAGAIMAALALIVVFIWRDGLKGPGREREMLAILAIGLLVNAGIFGGLSAPVDRYQSRVIWLLAVFAALLWLARRDAARGSGPPARSEAAAP